MSRPSPKPKSNPSPLHEGLIKLTELDPPATARMLRDLFHLPLPTGGAHRLASPDLSEATPAALRSDSFLTFEDGDHRYGVIVEVQLQPDPGKLLTWPWYVTSGRAREGCPVCLVVLCPTRQVAAWAARPIDTGHPGLVLRPLVIGPGNTPVITDVRQAAGNLGLAAIAAITHSEDPQINTILKTLTDALDTIDPQQAQRYAEFVTVALPGTAQKEMERLMATQSYLYQGEYARSLKAEGHAEGEAQGRAEEGTRAVLLVLDSRGVQLSEQDRERILACSDIDTLERWLRRAAVAITAGEIFS